MSSLLNSHEIPVGLGMALAENIEAMKYFTSLEESEQRKIIDYTHTIKSRMQMHLFVNNFFKM